MALSVFTTQEVQTLQNSCPANQVTKLGEKINEVIQTVLDGDGGLLLVTHDATLTGKGTVADPLKVAAPGLASVSVDEFITGDGTPGDPLSGVAFYSRSIPVPVLADDFAGKQFASGADWTTVGLGNSQSAIPDSFVGDTVQAIEVFFQALATRIDTNDYTVRLTVEIWSKDFSSLLTTIEGAEVTLTGVGLTHSLPLKVDVPVQYAGCCIDIKPQTKNAAAANIFLQIWGYGGNITRTYTPVA